MIDRATPVTALLDALEAALLSDDDAALDADDGRFIVTTPTYRIEIDGAVPRLSVNGARIALTTLDRLHLHVFRRAMRRAQRQAERDALTSVAATIHAAHSPGSTTDREGAAES